MENASDHKVWLCHAVWPYLQRCHLKNALKTKLNKGDPNYKCVIELERDPIRKHMIQTFLSFLPGAWYSTFHKHVFSFSLHFLILFFNVKLNLQFLPGVWYPASHLRVSLNAH